MTPTLVTPRLLLRPLQLEDAKQAQLLFPQWDIVRYLANRVPWPFPSDGVLSYYRDVALPAIERGNEWHWTLRLKTTPAQLIGSIGLMKNENENRGFWIGLPWQRKGLMSEACDAVTDFWFNELKFPVLRVPKAIGNVGSRCISQRQRMRIIRMEERDYVCGRLPTEIWEITAEEWRAQSAHLNTDKAQPK